jgi:hypothetical protein
MYFLEHSRLFHGFRCGAADHAGRRPGPGPGPCRGAGPALRAAGALVCVPGRMYHSSRSHPHSAGSRSPTPCSGRGGRSRRATQPSAWASSVLPLPSVRAPTPSPCAYVRERVTMSRELTRRWGGGRGQTCTRFGPSSRTALPRPSSLRAAAAMVRQRPRRSSARPLYRDHLCLHRFFFLCRSFITRPNDSSPHARHAAPHPATRQAGTGPQRAHVLKR